MPEIITETNFSVTDIKQLQSASKVFYFDLKYILGKYNTRKLILDHWKNTFTLFEKIFKREKYKSTTYREKVFNFYLNKILTDHLERKYNA